MIIVEQLDLTDIFRILHPKKQKTHSFQLHMGQSVGLNTY